MFRYPKLEKPRKNYTNTAIGKGQRLKYVNEKDLPPDFFKDPQDDKEDLSEYSVG